MGIALKQLFMACATLFGAIDKSAKALDHLATWAEESAGAFADEARENRKKNLKLLQQDAE